MAIFLHHIFPFRHDLHVLYMNKMSKNEYILKGLAQQIMGKFIE